MSSIRDDHDLLLEAPDPVQAELARSLLQEHGIPSLMHGVDRDLAEFGGGVHARLVRPDLYVPKGARARALEILEQSWEEQPLEAGFDVGTAEPEPPTRASSTPAARDSALILLLSVLALIVVAVLVVRLKLVDLGG